MASAQDFDLEEILATLSDIDNEIAKSRSTREYLGRDHEAGDEQIYRDYFAPNALYPPNVFRRRFRMNRLLFLRILKGDARRRGQDILEFWNLFTKKFPYF